MDVIRLFIARERVGVSHQWIKFGFQTGDEMVQGLVPRSEEGLVRVLEFEGCV